MTRSAPAQRAFSSGEISPLLAGRTDYQRHQTGLETCRGFLPLVEGGFTVAPGSIYRGRVRADAEAILLPFEFSAEDAVTLELTDGRMRVWRYGALVEATPGVPYELAIPYSLDAIKRLKWVQSADVIYLVDGEIQPQKLSRFALNNWTIEPVEFTNGPLRPWNDAENITVSASGITGSVTLTATGGDVFEAGHVGSLFALRVIDWTGTPIWTGNQGVSLGARMRYDGAVYEVVEPIGSGNTGVNPPIHSRGKQLSQSGGITWKHIGTDTGLVKITAVASGASATATVVDAIPDELVTGTGATYEWAHAAWSQVYGWPGAIAIHDQRLFFAATPTEPRSIWASVLGLFEDFEAGAEADLAFGYTIAAKRGINRILWIESGQRGLTIGALGEVQASRSSVAQEAITIENVAFTMIATTGVADVQPVSPDGFPIFISRDGGRVFETKYSLSEDKVAPRHLSLPARHLGGVGFTSIVWQSAPVRIGWLTRGNGELVAMIHEPDEDVLGWAVLPMAGGFVESVAVSAALGGGADEVTMVVRRTINGQTVRTVEALAPFYGLLSGATPIEEAMHLYCGSVLSFASPTATISGLEHLEGEQVLAWTELGQFGPMTVTAGTIELSTGVTSARIGLDDQTRRARTLGLYAAVRDGDPTGRKINMRRLGVRLYRTGSYRVRAVQRRWGRSAIEQEWRERRAGQVPGDLTEAFDGVDDPNITVGFDLEIMLDLSPLGAAPMTVLAVAPILEAQG